MADIYDGGPCAIAKYRKILQLSAVRFRGCPFLKWWPPSSEKVDRCTLLIDFPSWWNKKGGFPNYPYKSRFHNC